MNQSFERTPDKNSGTAFSDSRNILRERLCTIQGLMLTMPAGILLYLLTGRAPRMLLDAQGAMPHVSLAGAVPEATARDARWAQARRLITDEQRRDRQKGQARRVHRN
jgi:hypothetical protein